MITIVIHNSQFIIHNYDYFRLLCLLLHITCELVNPNLVNPNLVNSNLVNPNLVN